MSDVLVAIVGAFGLIVVALISNRGRQHAKAAREQVENNHDTNLREELTDFHAENVSKLGTIDELVTWQVAHQKQADSALRRLVRLEFLIVPFALLAGALGIVRTAKRMRKR